MQQVTEICKAGPEASYVLRQQAVNGVLQGRIVLLRSTGVETLGGIGKLNLFVPGKLL